MPDRAPAAETRAKRQRRRRRFLVWTAVLFAALLSGATASAFWLKGREFVAPDWLRARIVALIDPQMQPMHLSFGDLVIRIGERWQPRIAVRDVVLRGPDGGELISVADVSAALHPAALRDGRAQLRAVQASGVVLTLRRAEDGSMSLTASAQAGALSEAAPNLLQLVSQLDEILLQPELEGLESADIRAVTLRYEDRRASRVWTVDGGRMRLDRAGRDLQVALDLAVLGGASGVATLSANYAGTIGTQQSEFGLTLQNLDARDVASQGPALGWLSALQAPVSGALRGGTTAEGAFTPLNATLQIGAGVIQPTPESAPIPIDGAQSYFAYLPERQVLRFDTLQVDSKWGSGRMEGQARLGPVTNGQLQSLVGQLRFTDLSINPDGLYPDPVALEAAELDFRLHLAPFEMEIGRLQIRDQGRILSSGGHVRADAEGWAIAMDGELDAIEAPRLLALWPERLKPKTRDWVAKNVKAGRIEDAKTALRFAQGERPRLYLSFDFDEADFTFSRHMPPVSQAKGHASLVKDRFILVLDDGAVAAAEDGAVAVAGTSFIIPDTTAKPDPPGVVRLAATGSLPAALSLLDRPPLEVMSKRNLPVRIAEGAVEIGGTLSMPLRKGIKINDVTFDLAGAIRAAQSDVLVKGRRLEADALALTLSDDLLRIAGDAVLDGLPLDLVWEQPLGVPGGTGSEVRGRIALSQEALDTFNVTLPPGTVEGRAEAEFTLALASAQPPRLSLRSDLEGMRVAIPPLGWAKSTGAEGRLEVDVALAEPARVDRLVLDLPGLYASGTVQLTPEGQLDVLRLAEVRIGNWLQAPVEIRGRGAGRPVAIALTGGSVDLRRADLPRRSAGAGRGPPLEVALDRLQISDTIALQNLTGRFADEGGLNGTFRGQLNGRAEISGTVTPQNGRSAITFAARDGGQVLAAAGLAQQVRGGAMQVHLIPVGTGGAFDGKLSLKDTRILDAPAIAALLNAISGVGLVNELNGDGIYFSDVRADFRLAPARITLRNASAEGASMGISMDGYFEPDSGRLQVDGVISPVYMLNSIGSVLTRRGEGLFGFNYSISGTAQNPQVFVNPLTALAPGMFRDLFRGARPEVPLEEGEPVPVPEPRRKPVVTRGEDR